jgi:hypothetical protein
MSNGNEIEVLILTKRGRDKKESRASYFLDRSKPFGDVVDAHHKTNNAAENTFAYRFQYDGYKIDPNQYRDSLDVLGFDNVEAVVAYRKRKPKEKEKEKPTRRHRQPRPRESARRRGGSRSNPRKSK